MSVQWAVRLTLQLGVELGQEVHVEDLSDDLLWEVVCQGQSVGQEHQQVRVKRACSRREDTSVIKALIQHTAPETLQ